MTDLPHFSLPFRFAPSQAAVNEQDSLDEISDCVLAVLLCPQGFRVELPEFGTPDMTFTQPDVDQLRTVIDQWEPRAKVALTEQPSRYDELIGIVQVLVRERTET
jgi:phage baseplate assembly protein W